MRNRALLALSLLAASVAFGACREQEVVPPTVRPTPPTWSVTRDEAEPYALLLDVVATSPCRVRVRIEGVAEGSTGATERVLAAGEGLRLSVRAEVDGAPRPNAPVSAAEQAAGRTEAWAANLEYAWNDALGGRRRQVVGTRPALGRGLGPWFVLPPRAASPLQFDHDLDLACVAVVDGAGEVEIEGREQGSRLRWTPLPGADDRGTLLRVVLRAERLEP